MVLFALATASSGVRKVMTDSTGPKTSSRAMRCAGETWVNTVGLNQKPLLGQHAVGLPALRALGVPDVGELADAGQLLGGVDRAEVGVLVQRVADAQRADPPLQARR